MDIRSTMRGQVPEETTGEKRQQLATSKEATTIEIQGRIANIAAHLAQETTSEIMGENQADTDAARDNGATARPDKLGDNVRRAAQPIDARLMEQKQALADQEVRHNQAALAARVELDRRHRVLNKRVGQLAVTHSLVVLTEHELEGAFIELAEQLARPLERARWGEKGQAAADKRDEERKPRQDVYVGLRGPVSQAFRTHLAELGCKFSSRSANYATLKAKVAPDALITLAAANNQEVWLLDENMEKVFIHKPAEGQQNREKVTPRSEATFEATINSRPGFRHGRFGVATKSGATPNEIQNGSDTVDDEEL